jgi:NADPH2:quinone reductase
VVTGRSQSCLETSESTMQAILYDPTAPHGLRLDVAPDPQPTQHEALIAVHAFALNFADVAYLAKRRKPGDVVGFESAGTVLQAAADGSGPPAGARVTGFGPAGGWAEKRAVSSAELAVVPDAIEIATAAAVPVAGVTALRAIRALGPVLGRRILVTGASGGVGRMAVQLAARAGAHVIACVGQPERAAGLAELGAAEVVFDLREVAPVYGVLENVGGDLLARAYALLEPRGCVQSIGMASLELTSIDFEQARLRGGGRIEAFNVFSHGGAFGADIAALLERVARGELDPQVGWRGPWTKITEAIDAFRNRRVRGKAVLEVRGSANTR